jgi:micrococcal nuclease
MSRLLFSFSFIFLITFAAAPLSSISKQDFTGQAAYDVVRILAGDMIIVKVAGRDMEVQLIGVDTPKEAYGKEAARFITNLLKGEKVYLMRDTKSGETNHHGRTLAHLYRAPDGLWVNLEIVRQGYGHVYTQLPFEHRDLFNYYERRARKSGKGIWELPESKAQQPHQVEVEDAAGKQDKTVYITRLGTKYHREDCSSLHKSKVAVSLKDAKARGLGPCSRCNPPQ